MKENVEQMRKLNLSGLAIGVSDKYAIGDDGTVYIKWDFEMNQMKRLVSTEKKEDIEDLVPRRRVPFEIRL